MFNFIASALMIYLLVNVLAPPGSMQPETRTFVEAARLPLMHEVLSGVGISIPPSPLNLSFLWALVCALGVWRADLATRSSATSCASSAPTRMPPSMPA